ncbi:hypothetical protein ACFYMI_34080 [Streptomyces collinus]|uniref:hypothetical protein n=1 Tax=Streptomyces collinus TaxID=42684 RepID=UPI003686BEC2
MLLLQLQDLHLKVSDALVGEAQVRAGSLESFLQSVISGELLDSVLEVRVLGDQGVDGFSGRGLAEIPQLAYELAETLPLDEDLLLDACEFGFGILRSEPGRPGKAEPVRWRVCR